MEYAITSFALLMGGGFALIFFIPEAIRSYNVYVHGFYLLLGLPLP